MSDVSIAKSLDIRNEVCPYTFVKSKLELEGLNNGETLEILLGNSESAANVPRSLEGEGHIIEALEKPEKRIWRILVTKKG
ncbi:MAG: sulfurtransferase TusA family protein [Salinispira sp.]